MKQRHESAGVTSTGRRRGRRSGGEDTKAALLDAARAVFAEQGYQGATVRGIAARAGVDAAMVNHWFGGKQGLFAATIELPFQPAELIDGVVAGDPAQLAERIVRTFLTLWDTHEGRFATLVLSVASQEMAARMMAEFFAGAVFGRFAEAAGGDGADLRAALCGTQVVGLGLVRYVLKLEPVASADVDTLVRHDRPDAAALPDRRALGCPGVAAGKRAQERTLVFRQQDVRVEARAVAGVARGFDLVHLQQHRVAVAVQPDLADPLRVPGRLSLDPQAIAGAGEVRGLPRGEGEVQGLRRSSTPPSAPRRCRVPARRRTPVRQRCA